MGFRRDVKKATVYGGGVIGSAACSIDIKNCVSGQEGKKNKYIASNF